MIMKTKKTQSRSQIAEELVEAVDSKFFKTLSEPVRVQILKYLMLNGRADIQTIAENMPQDRSVISRHLNLMQEAGILTCLEAYSQLWSGYRLARLALDTSISELEPAHSRF